MSPAGVPFGGRPAADRGVPPAVVPVGRGAEAALALRLVPVALAGWVVTWLGLGWSPATSVLVGCCCAVPAMALARCDRPTARIAMVALGGAAVAAFLVGTRVHARDASPLHDLAIARSRATLWLVVRDDPRPLRAGGVGGRPQVAVPARALRVGSGGRRWRSHAAVLVLAPADGWRTLLPSQRLRVTGRLLPASGDLTVAVLAARGPPEQVAEPSRVQRVAEQFRRGLRDAATVLPAAGRGLLPGLVLGDTTNLDPTVAEDFRTAGLTHLLAVSGANVAIVIGAVLLLCRWCRLDPRFSAVLSGLALVGFVVLVRPSPSVLRAAAMGALALLALATGRARQGVPALAAAVLTLVLIWSDLARSAGFALSVLATAALLVVAPRWSTALRGHGVPSGLAEALTVPAAACLATAPITAVLAGQISLVGIPANLLAAPAVAPATVLGVVATLVDPVSSTAARVVAWVAGLPTEWLVTVARGASGARLASVPWPGAGGGLWSLALPVLLAGLTLALLRFRSVRRALLAVVVAALLVTVPTRWALFGWPPTGWMLVACDVGQGDGLVVNAGPGTAVVVDTGPDPARMDRCLRRLGVVAVPLLVLTHLHADHAGGLAGVLRARRVAAIETGPLSEPAWEWDTVREIAAAHRVPLLRATVGETRQVAGVRLDVLAPTHPFHRTRSDPNNSSVVLRVTAHGHTMLLTGDVEVEAQQELLDRGTDLTAELVKVPHHGSAHGDPRFLAATRARVAVISVGADNDYGHPAPTLLAGLTRLGMRTYRTDQDGDVAACDRAGELVMVTRARGPPVDTATAVVVATPGGFGVMAARSSRGCGMPPWSGADVNRAQSADPCRGRGGVPGLPRGGRGGRRRQSRRPPV